MHYKGKFKQLSRINDITINYVSLGNLIKNIIILIPFADHTSFQEDMIWNLDCFLWELRFNLGTFLTWCTSNFNNLAFPKFPIFR